MSCFTFRPRNLTLLLPTLICTLFSGLPVNAGPTDRGGGNAVVCFSGAKKDQKQTKKIMEQIKKEGQTLNRKLFPFVESIELNEIYELRSLRDEDGKPYSLIQIDPKQKPSEFMNAIIAKYQGTYASIVANMIQVGRQEFSQLNQTRQDTPIPFVGDFNLLRTIDSGRCAVVTVASQTSGSPDLLQIDEPLRALMAEKSPISDRALMLHEYILLYTRHVNRSSSSDSARAVLRMLLVDDATLTPARVLRILKGAGIIQWDVEANILGQIGTQLSHDIFLFASEVSKKVTNVWTASPEAHPYQIARARFDRLFYENGGEKLCDLFTDSSWDGPCRSAAGVHYDKSFWSVLLLQKAVTLRLQRNIQKFLNGEAVESALAPIKTQNLSRLQSLVPVLEKIVEGHTNTFDRLANVPKEAWQSSIGSAFITTQKRYSLSDAQVLELRNWLVNLGKDVFPRFTPQILSEPRAHYEDPVYQFFMKPSSDDFYHKLEGGHYGVGFSLTRLSYGAIKSLTYPFPLTPEIVISLQKFRE